MTGQRAQSIIAICWVLSIIIGLTPMMGWHKMLPDPIPDCATGLMKCLFEKVVVMEYMVYFNFFGCVLIPLLLMLAIYLCIFMAARHQLKLIEVEAAHGEKSHSTLHKEVQAAKSLSIIVGLFAVCWLPLHIINCFTLFCPQCERAHEFIMYVAILLSHANSVINPFIYAYRIREFRQTFRRIIRHHVLNQRESLESSGSLRTSTYNSVTDSVRFRANGLTFDLVSERSGSICESSYHCPTHISPVGGALVAAAHLPLSVIVSHCPGLDPCLLQALRQTPILIGPHVHYAGQQHDCGEPGVAQETDSDGGGGSAQVTVLLNQQSRKSCRSELAATS